MIQIPTPAQMEHLCQERLDWMSPLGWKKLWERVDGEVMDEPVPKEAFIGLCLAEADRTGLNVLYIFVVLVFEDKIECRRYSVTQRNTVAAEVHRNSQATRWPSRFVLHPAKPKATPMTPMDDF